MSNNDAGRESKKTSDVKIHTWIIHIFRYSVQLCIRSFGTRYGSLLHSLHYFGGSILRRDSALLNPAFSNNFQTFCILKKVQTYGNPNSAVWRNSVFPCLSLPTSQQPFQAISQLLLLLHKLPIRATSTNFRRAITNYKNRILN